jgi:hypothetical protein
VFFIDATFGLVGWWLEDLEPNPIEAKQAGAGAQPQEPVRALPPT